LLSLIPLGIPLELKGAIFEALAAFCEPGAGAQPYRLPGIGPYISLVVEHVFAKIPNREYIRPSDRWETNDLCLCFIERSLASFNLESLVTGPDDPPLNLEPLVPILIHPGYDIIKHLLMDSQLHASILSYVVGGLEGYEKGLADKDPFFRNTIVRVLRIVLRALKVQDIFLDVFRGTFARKCRRSIYRQNAGSSLFKYPYNGAEVDGLDRYPSSVIHCISTTFCGVIHQKWLYVGSLTFRSVRSVKILAKLSLSISPSTLVAGTPSMDSKSGSLERANRLAALDLLIQGTELHRPLISLTSYFSVVT
jgi:nuclear pore complex protein Nup205